MYDARAQETERIIEDLLRRLARLEQRVTAGNQQVAQLWQVPPGGGGGGTQIAYWAMSPIGGMAASSGTFPTITPTTANLTVYTDVGGTLTAAGTAVCRWFYRDALAQYKLLPLQPNGDGSFDILASSCTIVNP